MFNYLPNRKIFIKEQDDIPELQKDKNPQKYMNVTLLSGEKAKEFYENLLSENFSSKKEKIILPTPEKVEKKIKKNSNKYFKDTDLLFIAQNNDIKNLELFFSQKKNCNVDIVDEFGWTPLMCAACSGAEDAVKILLQNNADPNKCDKLGNTALQLARQKNQQKVINILKFFSKTKQLKNNEYKVSESIESFFCSICKENFKMNKNKHETSTLHLFNSKIKTSTFYGIPESNRGFQLLLKEGWDKEKGLGPNGTGRKFPIKAIMKKDRTGIGATPINSNKNNKRECQHTNKYENKKIKSYKRWKDKDFEKNFRLEFS